MHLDFYGDGLLSRHPGTEFGLNCRSQSLYDLPNPKPSPTLTGHIRPIPKLATVEQALKFAVRLC
jgi:hypothetical protein